MDAKAELSVKVRMSLTAAAREPVLVAALNGIDMSAEGFAKAVGAEVASCGVDGLADVVRTQGIPGVVCTDGMAFVVGSSPIQLTERLAAIEGDESEALVPAVTPMTRLQGKVVLVTGAAQGFGKGIAEELVKAGAAVVVADLNVALGRETVGELEALAGTGCAIFVPMNVTDSASAGAAVAATVARFGGLDMLVSNAGVLKAGGIEALEESAFDLVNGVNYKGYFICVKAVAPVMRLQHQINPAHFMDIVQINSKSGLEGSKNNFAYAGSKFGAIGLTQSFALELVTDNVKVNSICPGNFFDGPLWSDPERGLFKQYLDTAKVPGATTIADVKAFYMAKVPMGRGCTPEDVAKAILYVHDQCYETGQAIPVTGGQVMLT